METKKDFLYSYYRIRKTIGLLGVLLPIMVVAFYGELIASISHYYYTKSSVFFIAILTSFGLFLISYRGYERDKKKELLSDNVITHVGGIAAILVVLFPTSCLESGSEQLDLMCKAGVFPLFGHVDKLYSTIHLLSAGIFLFAMGWMAIFRFTKGKPTPENKRKNRFYRISGYIMWASIGILLLEFAFNFHFTTYDVFILETISVFAFGISWLIKGKALKDIMDLRKNLGKPKQTSKN